MIFFVIAMLAIVLVAGLIVTYVAYPHRGAAVPGASWLGDVMTRGVERLPRLEEDEARDPGSARRPAEDRLLV